MNILVLGASGNIGSLLVEKLRQEHNVVAFVREKSNAERLEGCRVLKGDLERHETIKPALEGIEMIINASYIVFAGNILKAVGESGSRIKRIIFIGSAGIYTKLPSASASGKRSAEELIRRSAVPYTILRPTMIYGIETDRNIFRLISFLHRFRVFPVFGDGKNLLQPVHLDDVAQAVISAMNTSMTLNRCYDIGGMEAVTFDRLIDITAGKMGKRAFKVHIPLRASLWLARCARLLIGKFPVKDEQIKRLGEDKVVDGSQAALDFGYRPMSLHEGIRREVGLFYRVKGMKGPGPAA